MYRALATIFAGYWRPTLATRLWVDLFLLLVRMQKSFGFVAKRQGSQAVAADASSPAPTD